MQCKDGDSHGIENSGECELEFLALVLDNHQMYNFSGD
jgi:hypothetical protein